MFQHIAKKEVGAYLESRLKEHYPSGGGRMKQLQAVCDEVASELGSPGALKMIADPNDDSRVMFTIDPLNAIFMAAKIAELRRHK